ncbi:helix-turn-helix domain-containing protein [Halonatronum saccharophilum]|uniref:helix-turn-helix domain-containing protein n=1 Tax=Halonatronum saccharophilum TaxID=150060 RepID=UPI0004B67684|nr:helix-turn-helix transcriptional regulator [Halonatronum saccharophilum]
MFKERIRKLRKENKLTQQQLADKIGVGRATIAGYETKGKEPGYDTLSKLAEIFNVSVDYLLGRTDNKQNPGSNTKIPDGVKELLSDEESKFIVDLLNKESVQLYLREARGASDEDLATAVRVLKAVREGKEKGTTL